MKNASKDKFDAEMKSGYYTVIITYATHDGELQVMEKAWG